MIWPHETSTNYAIPVDRPMRVTVCEWVCRLCSHEFWVCFFPFCLLIFDWAKWCNFSTLACILCRNCIFKQSIIIFGSSKLIKFCPSFCISPKPTVIQTQMSCDANLCLHPPHITTICDKLFFSNQFFCCVLLFLVLDSRMQLAKLSILFKAQSELVFIYFTKELTIKLDTLCK